MDHHDSHHHHHQILSGAVVSRRESDRETVFVEGSRTCRSFNALMLIIIAIINIMVILMIILIINIIIIITFKMMITHLALVGLETQAELGIPTQRSEQVNRI